MMRQRNRFFLAAATLTPCLTSISCGSEPNSIRLVTYSSFPAEGAGVNDALAAFSERTGIDVTILNAGDAGTMVTKAVLASGSPEGDVMWGVDNTLLSRATAADVFDGYLPKASVGFDDELLALGDGIVVPVDFGDVCVNYDRAWFDAADLTPPTHREQLADAQYAGLLTVQNPGSSSPGLAFMLATIARFGDGWTDYWSALVEHDVLVVDDWEQAYYGAFTRAGGDRPLVVSYGSSPPFEVLYGDDPEATTAPTGVIEDTCYRQVEFAGVLRGTKSPDAARQLVDFLVSEEFQQHVALDLYVFPVADVALDPVFTRHAVIPDSPRVLTPAAIDAGRADWIAQWNMIAG